MIHLQEFFGSRDNLERLILKLQETGFERKPKSQSTFECEGAFVDVQNIDLPTHIAKDNPVPYGFVLELYRPLAEYVQKHPVREFFRKLEEPRAYGLMQLKPKYSISDYRG